MIKGIFFNFDGWKLFDILKLIQVFICLFFENHCIGGRFQWRSWQWEVWNFFIRKLTLKKSVPINSFKESMSLNLRRSSMNVPPTFWEILFTKMLDYTFGTRVKVFWEQDFLFQNHLEDFVRSLGNKWGLADHKFIKHNAKSVPISSISITLT